MLKLPSEDNVRKDDGVHEQLELELQGELTVVGEERAKRPLSRKESRISIDEDNEGHADETDERAIRLTPTAKTRSEKSAFPVRFDAKRIGPRRSKR